LFRDNVDMRALTFVQKDWLTKRLFFAVAAGCVFTVAAPTLFPCPALEKKKAREQQELQSRTWFGQTPLRYFTAAGAPPTDISNSKSSSLES
ncbi:hypothetical protein IWQ62_002952, partial [Dispira parvispora]